MSAIHVTVGGNGVFDVLSVGAILVVVGAVAYVLAEVARARRRQEPVGPIARKAIRAAALPAGAALVALVAVGIAVVLVAFLILYLVIAVIVASFSGNPHGLGSLIAGLAIAFFFAVVLAVTAVALGVMSLARTWFRRSRGKTSRP